MAQLPEVLLRVLLKAQLLLQLLLLELWGAWRGLPGELSHNWPKQTRTNLQAVLRIRIRDPVPF
jgi:hypothetical protein